jgi:Family of unknown function (DUF5670)
LFCHVKDTEQDLPSRFGPQISPPVNRVRVAGKSPVRACGYNRVSPFWGAWHGRCDASSERRHTVAGEEIDMLWTIFVVLLVLWALGMVSSYTIGGFIHILLVIAIAVVLIRIIQGRRPV